MVRSVQDRRAGFSIVELMLAVAILGVLAALAVTQFREYQMDARRAELATNMSGLYDTVTIFHLHRDPEPLIGDWNPSRGSMTRDPRDWNTDVTAHQMEAWAKLGWRPDGQVRCSYLFEDLGRAEEYYARGACDLDGDGREAEQWWFGPGLRGGGDKIVDTNPKEY
ncbi:MAG: prepilin-type N-terminal cleavage/methylation domain-containing protein [Alphaproteobacteria bacterium]|nr:prepilin-type N-terminal cleavage/methylation domain-containing protein [Alphaproteobacteria bacterium]